MSKTTGNCSNASISCIERPTRSRAPSLRKCCACQCQAGPQESSRVGVRKGTTMRMNANKPQKVGPDVLPSVARAKSSVHLRPDSLKNKPRKPTTVSAETSTVLDQNGTGSAQETAGDVKEIAQVSKTPRIRKQPAIPPSNVTTLKTATPRQICRKKADVTPGKLKKPAVPKRDPVEKPGNHPPENISYGYHIKWDGIDELEYRVGQDCSLCETDLAVCSSGSDNGTEFTTLPVVGMLRCGHAFHVTCLGKAELADLGDPFCVLCESMSM